MPITPNFSIAYPCEGSAITLADFANLATTTEAAVIAVLAEARAVTHTPNARALGTSAAAFGVEDTMIYTLVPTSVVSSGITVNAAAGTFTILTPGIYLATVRLGGNSSTLTMTSQRVATAVNGVNQTVRKYRGFNPATTEAIAGAWTSDILCAAGDVVTFRYLWTGTGALSGTASATVALDLLATP